MGLDYKLKPIASRSKEAESEEFRRLNPRGKIPVLQDGDFVLSESLAIGTYLSDTYGTHR